MDKRVLIHLQAGRKVTGSLRGFDIFLNLVLDDSLDESFTGQKINIGQVVSWSVLLHTLIYLYTHY